MAQRLAKIALEARTGASCALRFSGKLKAWRVPQRRDDAYDAIPRWGLAVQIQMMANLLRLRCAALDATPRSVRPAYALRAFAARDLSAVYDWDCFLRNKIYAAAPRTERCPRL